MSFPFAAAFAAFFVAASNPGTSAQAAPVVVQQEVPLIQVDELQALMAGKRPFLLVDVREPGEFDQGHIQGAVLMPLSSLPADYRKITRGVTLVVYCRTGHRSAQAVGFLRAHGFGRAVSLAGGYTAWSGAQQH